MKHFIVLITIACAGFARAQEEITSPEPVEASPVSTEPIEIQPVAREPYEYVDEPAEFPGGLSALSKYLRDNLVYPQRALEEEIEGKCFLRFIVAADGTISDIKVQRGVAECPECDAEAIRVVKGMPAWTPAKMNGKSVASVFNLPFIFHIH